MDCRLIGDRDRRFEGNSALFPSLLFALTA